MTFALDKMQIDDALGVRTYQMPAGTPNPGAPFGAPPLGAPQQPQPMATRFGGLSPHVGMQAGPGHLQMGAGVGPQGQMQGVNAGYSMPVGPGTLNINGGLNPLFKMAQLGAQYQAGPASVNVNYQPSAGMGAGVQYQNGPLAVGGGYDPRRGAYGNLAVRQRFQEGGLATSVAAPKDYHQQAVDFINTADQHMREMAGKHAYEFGGFAVK